MKPVMEAISPVLIPEQMVLIKPIPAMHRFFNGMQAHKVGKRLTVRINLAMF
jgi:hypothetical protein